jgi:hypothetical protein
MTTKLSKKQLLSELAQLTTRIQERFPDVEVEYHDRLALWGQDHASLEQRGFVMPSPEVDASLLIRGGDADREDAAQMADNLVDELRERDGAIVQVRATSEVWCRESQPMRVETYVPGRPTKTLSFLKVCQDDERGLVFFCINDAPNHQHTWDKLKPAEPLH